MPRTGDTNTLSDESSDPDHDTIAAAAAIPASGLVAPGTAAPGNQYNVNPYELDRIPTHATEQQRDHDAETAPMLAYDGATPVQTPMERQRYDPGQQTTTSAVPTQTFVLPINGQAPTRQVQSNQNDVPTAATSQPEQSQSPTSPRFIQPQDRHSSTYGDWFSGAAVGAGAGAVGAGTYLRYKQKREANDTPVLEEAQDRTLPTSSEIDAAVYAPGRESTSTAGGSTLTQSTAPTSVSGLGGLESAGAHKTGHVFPAIIRHDTDMSISALHVPGEFPKSGVATTSSAGSAVPTNKAWERARE